jgi:hypothetical protein
MLSVFEMFTHLISIPLLFTFRKIQTIPPIELLFQQKKHNKFGYADAIPSSNYLTMALNCDIERKMNYFNFEVQCWDTNIGSFDTSYKVQNLY